MGILEVKITLSDIKLPLDRINGRLDTAIEKM